MSYSSNEICAQYRPWVGQEPLCGNCGHPKDIHVPGKLGYIGVDPAVPGAERTVTRPIASRRNPYRHTAARLRALRIGHFTTNRTGRHKDKRRGPRAGRVRARLRGPILRGHVGGMAVTAYHFPEIRMEATS